MIRKLAFVTALMFLTVQINALESQLFPEIQGWKLKVNEKVYNSGDLWELIDGAADIFLSYNFEDLHIAEYTKKNQMIRVELYRHKSTDDTYGIFTAERMPDYPRVSIGSLGYKSQGVLNFMAGNYYVKIMSAGISEADGQTIEIVANKVDLQLSQPKGLPEVIGLFPDEGKIAFSDTYIAQNFMGYSFFHHAFSVKYDKPADFQLFIIRLTTAEIQKMLDQYIQMMKEDKVQQKEGLFVISDLFNGTVFLYPQQEYLIGVLNTANETMAAEYINKVRKKLNE